MFNAEQTEANTKMRDDLSKQLHTYVLSGNGITAVRTRDPMATAQAAVAFQAAQGNPVKIWDAARGWLTGTDPIEDGGDGNLNLVNAFKGLLTPDASAQFPHKGLYVFCMIHHHLTPARPNPELLQLLTLMAHNLPRSVSERRVLLCVPPSFTVPPELRELIPVVDHKAPGVDDLAETLNFTLEDMASVAGRYMPDLTDQDMTRLGQAAVGMITPEVESAFSRVLYRSAVEKKHQTPESLRTALIKEKADMVKRSRALEVMPAVALDQVGGLGPLKTWVRSRVRAMDPAAWELGVDKPKGCALIGPPGTGKSLLGKVIGGVLGVATIRFDVSSVFAGLVGSSEENMREALFMLESLAPCVVLLDELDKVFSTGGSGDSGVSQKVMGALLTFMQETTKPIFWVPTMNRTENVPAELMRAGRIDEVFGVARPGETERQEILNIHLTKRKVDPASVGDLYDAVKGMDGFVGAEIEAVAASARLAAFNEGDDVEVRLEHIMAAIRATKPLSRKMPEQFEAMEAWCKENAVAANEPAGMVATTSTGATAKPRRRRAIASPAARERMN